MLEIIAYHDPIDYHRLRRLVGERLNGQYSTERHREALENLKELDMVIKPGMSHEYLHITDIGWSHLGGDTPRHADNIETQEAPVCPVCATDDLVETDW